MHILHCPIVVKQCTICMLWVIGAPPFKVNLVTTNESRASSAAYKCWLFTAGCIICQNRFGANVGRNRSLTPKGRLVVINRCGVLHNTLSATRVASKRARDKCKINTAALFAGQFFSLFARRSTAWFEYEMRRQLLRSVLSLSLLCVSQKFPSQTRRRREKEKTRMCRRSEIYSAVASGTYKSVPRFTNKSALVCLREQKERHTKYWWPGTKATSRPTDCPSDRQNARSTLIFHQSPRRHGRKRTLEIMFNSRTWIFNASTESVRKIMPEN
jgi:hypothetical protein